MTWLRRNSTYLSHAAKLERSSRGTANRSCNRIRAKQGRHVWYIRSGYKHLHAVSAVSLVKFELMLLQYFSPFCLCVFLPWFTFLFPWQHLAAVCAHRSHCDALSSSRPAPMGTKVKSTLFCLRSLTDPMSLLCKRRVYDFQGPGRCWTTTDRPYESCKNISGLVPQRLPLRNWYNCGTNHLKQTSVRNYKPNLIE